MSGFDRIKPPERRLLEREESRQPDSSRADREGRAALFSASAPPSTPGAGARRRSPEPSPRTHEAGEQDRADRPSPPAGRSPVHVECSHCGVSSPLHLGDAIRHAIPLVLVAPWKSHPVFARCPACERRAWLRPRVGLPR
ncbi:hypothetical protein [Euzebya sp.]|uniref:hypothetical protein n=1 Tax=Euzebya sp. TaxID=1971409 RepID=UPI003510DC89